MVERRFCTPEVSGSIPLGSTETENTPTSKVSEYFLFNCRTYEVGNPPELAGFQLAG